jgi:hypothetical protein
MICWYSFSSGECADAQEPNVNCYNYMLLHHFMLKEPNRQIIYEHGKFQLRGNWMPISLWIGKKALCFLDKVWNGAWILNQAHAAYNAHNTRCKLHLEFGHKLLMYWNVTLHLALTCKKDLSSRIFSEEWRAAHSLSSTRLRAGERAKLHVNTWSFKAAEVRFLEFGHKLLMYWNVTLHLALTCKKDL